MDVNEEVNETIKLAHIRQLTDAANSVSDLAFTIASFWKTLRVHGLSRWESTQLTMLWMHTLKLDRPANES